MMKWNTIVISDDNWNTLLEYTLLEYTLLEYLSFHIGLSAIYHTSQLRLE